VIKPDGEFTKLTKKVPTGLYYRLL
jgi:hypothetical protein